MLQSERTSLTSWEAVIQVTKLHRETRVLEKLRQPPKGLTLPAYIQSHRS